MNYYNEIDPYCADWIRNLIAAGLIPGGEVDERDIRDVVPNELRGFTQCHFFAGIAGWSLALALAGWPPDRPVWTGSCPCQPFSAAGKGLGFADERHLWPAFFHLIKECGPDIVFGEQVEGKSARAWIDLVSSDLEGIGYACGKGVIPAAGVGAPEIRHRTWWVAYALSARRPEGWPESGSVTTSGSGSVGGLEYTESERRNGRKNPPGKARRGGLENASRMGYPDWQGRQGRQGRQGERGDDGEKLQAAERTGSPVGGFWGDAEWIDCLDGKQRPIEPGTFPLAHGVPGRVGKLRSYGNAIIPQVAAEFIKAVM